ncbi:MAG: hypothetical protein HYX52_08270 [Chloroflexi bacterium]|nr:hypothetical protein [Chloroflexota bacterium]
MDDEAVAHLARALADGGLGPSPWRMPPHWWDDAHPERTANVVLLLDALNFSFWGSPRWRVHWQGQDRDGYWGLAAALRHALDGGQPLWDAAFLESLDAATLLAGRDGVEIPLIEARQGAIREVSRGLAIVGGSLLTLVQQSEGQVGTFIRLVAEHFPSFHDVAEYRGQAVPLYKRAQILVADLHGATEGSVGDCWFADLESLTMFADYKVPQVLHGLGVLRYTEDLEAVLRSETLLETNDAREVEIRALSVHAVEKICAALRGLGSPLAPFQADWALWTLGQGRAWPLPYHRTRTTAY